MRIPSILVSSLAAATVLVAAPATAEVSISVSPALLELDGSAGARGGVQVSVSNPGDEAFDVIASLATLPGMEGERSALEWLAVTPERLSLEPGDEGFVEFSVDIPDGVASGGRYATLALVTAPPGGDAGTGMAGRIVVPVLLTVSGIGELTRRPNIARSALFLEPDGRLGARTEVHNDGNVHMPLAGEVTIAAPGPEIHADLRIPLGRVLPGATRAYATDATLPLPLGETYEITVRLGAPADVTAFDPLLEATAQAEATPRLTLTDLAVCENIDRGPSVSATVANEGTLGLVPTMTFEVRGVQGGSVRGSTSAQAVAWPGDRLAVASELPDPLPAGSYTLLARASLGVGEAVEASVPFDIGGDASIAAPPCATATTTPAPEG